jgi:hypothetical protein
MHLEEGACCPALVWLTKFRDELPCLPILALVIQLIYSRGGGIRQKSVASLPPWETTDAQANLLNVDTT